MIVVADTSGLVAALDSTHPDGDGDGARAVLRGAGPLVIPPVLLAQLDHVARRVLGRAAAVRAVDDVRRWARAGRAVLPTVDADVLDTAQVVRARHRDLELDLVDAVRVALAAAYRTAAILTLDHRDLRVVAPLTEHPAFQLLPADA